MSVHTFRQRAALRQLCPRELERMEREYYAARDHRSRHPFAIVCAIVVLLIVACALVACAAPERWQLVCMNGDKVAYVSGVLEYRPWMYEGAYTLGHGSTYMPRGGEVCTPIRK